MSDFLIEQIGDRKICLQGIGKLFYQDGFPISMSVEKLKDRGIEVSILHVADECLKNGWTAKTTFNKISADFEDDINKSTNDKGLLQKFCFASYEDQREMIFQYLFNDSPELQKIFFKRKI